MVSIFYQLVYLVVGKTTGALAQSRLSGWLRVENGAIGTHLTALLAPGLDDVPLAAALQRRGIESRPLSPFYRQAAPRHGLLLGFCGFDAGQLAQAVETLAQCLDETAGMVKKT